MKTNRNKDLHRFKRALNYAVDNGYVVPPLENEIFFKSSMPFGFSSSMKVWARGLILTKDFARAVFGWEKVSGEGIELVYIRARAKQVAYEYDGRIYQADRNRPFMSFVKEPHLDFMSSSEGGAFDPAQTLDFNVVTKKLEDLFATIPVDTHQLTDLEVEGGIPAYEYHLKQMVTSNNPFAYLDYYVSKKQKKG